jgi:hypothetical protein
MDGINPRVRGFVRWAGFILFLSALGAFLLLVRPWPLHVRTEGKKVAGMDSMGSKPVGQAKLVLGAPRVLTTTTAGTMFMPGCH